MLIFTLLTVHIFCRICLGDMNSPLSHQNCGPWTILNDKEYGYCICLIFIKHRTKELKIEHCTILAVSLWNGKPGICSNKARNDLLWLWAPSHYHALGKDRFVRRIFSISFSQHK